MTILGSTQERQRLAQTRRELDAAKFSAGMARILDLTLSVAQGLGPTVARAVRSDLDEANSRVAFLKSVGELAVVDVAAAENVNRRKRRRDEFRRIADGDMLAIGPDFRLAMDAKAHLDQTAAEYEREYTGGGRADWDALLKDPGPPAK